MRGCAPGARRQATAVLAWLPLADCHSLPLTAPQSGPSGPSDCQPAGREIWGAGRPSGHGTQGGEGRGGGGITDTILSTYYPPPLLHNHQPSSHSHGLSYKFPLFIFPPTLPSPPPSPPAHFPAAQNCWAAILHGPFRLSLFYSLGESLNDLSHSNSTPFIS